MHRLASEQIPAELPIPALTRPPSFGLPEGWRLLLRRKEILHALPRLGGTLAVSRNQNAILGGGCHYPTALTQQDPGIPQARLRHDIRAWDEIWNYHEVINQQAIEGIEFRDQSQIGFHKIIFTHQTDLQHTSLLTRALEDTPLSENDISSAIKANHADGMCCPDCARQMGSTRNPPVRQFLDFITNNIARRCPITVILTHGRHVDRRTFLPTAHTNHGPWHTIRGCHCDLYIRIASLRQFSVEPAAVHVLGPCRRATLRTKHQQTIATLIRHE